MFGGNKKLKKEIKDLKSELSELNSTVKKLLLMLSPYKIGDAVEYNVYGGYTNEPIGTAIRVIGEIDVEEFGKTVIFKYYTENGGYIASNEILGKCKYVREE